MLSTTDPRPGLFPLLKRGTNSRHNRQCDIPDIRSLASEKTFFHANHHAKARHREDIIHQRIQSFYTRPWSLFPINENHHGVIVSVKNQRRCGLSKHRSEYPTRLAERMVQGGKAVRQLIYKADLFVCHIVKHAQNTFPEALVAYTSDSLQHTRIVGQILSKLRDSPVEWSNFNLHIFWDSTAVASEDTSALAGTITTMGIQGGSSLG